MSKPAPPGWNKTIDDLFAEIRQGKRLIISGDEGDWARDYERSLLPRSAVFPRGGQIWETIDDCEVSVEYVFAAPAGFGGTATISRGEKVRIMEGGIDPEPIIVSFLPVRYDELHEHFVPADVRSIPRYTNYALDTKTAYFNGHFRLVEDVG